MNYDKAKLRKNLRHSTISNHNTQRYSRGKLLRTRWHDTRPDGCTWASSLCLWELSWTLTCLRRPSGDFGLKQNMLLITWLTWPAAPVWAEQQLSSIQFPFPCTTGEVDIIGVAHLSSCVFMCRFCFFLKRWRKNRTECFHPSCFIGGEVAAWKKNLPRVLIRRSLSSGDGAWAWALMWAFARGAARWSVHKIEKKVARRRALHLQRSAAAALQWICLSKQPFCACIRRRVSSVFLFFFFPFFPFFPSPSSTGTTAISRQNTDSRDACSR